MAAGGRKQAHPLVYPRLMKPDDLLTFIHFNHFTAEWRRLGLTDEDLQALEILIMSSPRMGAVMQGTGGLRKARFSPPRWKRGKSGALRIGYAYVEKHSVVGLIVVFAKNEQANLSAAQRKVIKTLLAKFEEEISRSSRKSE